MNSCSPMTRLDRPWATSQVTSRSRSVRPCPSAGTPVSDRSMTSALRLSKAVPLAQTARTSRTRPWSQDSSAAASEPRMARAEISAHEGRAGSDPPVVAHRQPRSPSRHPHAAELDQPHQPVAVRTVRREQDEHPGVVDDPANERPAHQAGQVEVAHGHRVRVAERPLGDLRRGPGTDARYGAQPSLRRRWRELNPLLPVSYTHLTL